MRRDGKIGITNRKGLHIHTLSKKVFWNRL